MKKVLIVTFLLIIASGMKTMAQSPWVQMPAFTSDNLFSGRCFSGECFVFGNLSGTNRIWRSIDGGQSWSSKNITYQGVTVLTPQRWIAGDYSDYTFYITPDSGNTWQHLPVLDGKYWQRFNFNTYSMIVAYEIPDWPTNDTAYLYISDDHFNTYRLYTKLNIDTFALQDNVFPIFLLDSLTVFKYDDGKLYKSLNAGNTWAYLSDLSYNPRIYFYNQNLGFYYDQMNVPNILYRTSNGGQSWNAVLNPASILLDFIICKNTDTCFAFGNNMMGDKRIYWSVNGGVSWQTSQNFNNNIRSLVLTDTMGVFAFGNSGLYVRSNFITGFFDDFSFNGQALNLYPNPNNGTFTVYVQTLNEPEQLQLTVMDVFGKQIINQQINNTSNHQIDLSAYSKGIYYVSVTGSNGFREVKKVVVN